MPSSFSFLRNSSSSSSSENDSKSDQSDDDDDVIGYYKKRTIENDNDLLERPSDHDDSSSQTDESDQDEKGNDLFISSSSSPPIPRSYFLPRQYTLYETDWPKKSSNDENKFQKSMNKNETSLLDFDRKDNTSFSDSNQHKLFSPERSKSLGIVDKIRDSYTTLPSEYLVSTQELHSIIEQDTMPISSQSKTNINRSSNDDIRRSISKIPVRAHSPSQSRSRSPTTTTTTNPGMQAPAISSKIPVSVSTTSKGAFRFVTDRDRSSSSKVASKTDTTQIPTTETAKQLSPFTPITHTKALPLAKKALSSAGNTPALKIRRTPLSNSDDNDENDDDDNEDDFETNNLKEEELKLKLKEQKRHGRITGDLLNKLHENYEELLEKYAQAENTIDQLRFQPRIFGDNTPTYNASEGAMHFIQQLKVNMATVRSSGIYQTSSMTPVSSIRQVTSTTSTVTPAAKSTSPANSGTAESVFFDEPIPQKIIVQELTTPETIKLDLLIQTKNLSDKMKSFLTLMDENQLSLSEQKQVYDTIKEDYEKLLKTLDRKKRESDLSDVDLDGDINQELETMKHLLKEIVKRISDNLRGKSTTSSETGHQGRLTRNGSHSSQLSVRSSLCNHGDLMDQYQKLLTAVNTEAIPKRDDDRSLRTDYKKPSSHHSSQSDISTHHRTTTRSQKPSIYTTDNFDDDEQQQQHNHRASPISSMRRIESTSFNLDHAPSTSPKQQQQTQLHGIKLSTTTTTKKKKTPSGPQRSISSIRTRASDYDSGIGMNNTVKLSRDRLNTSTIDESHYQTLDEDRRRYSEGEQETTTSLSSSRSSGSGATSPRNLSGKYTKRFNNSLSSKQLKENYRRKPSGHSDIDQSDIETYIAGSFDPLPRASSSASYRKKSRRNHHSWTPQPYHSRLTPYHRSQSIESFEKYSRPQTAPQISSRTEKYSKMARKYQSGFIHRPRDSSKYPPTMYKSSFYIDQPHTHKRSQETINQHQRTTQPTNNLYLDPQSGVIYRYIPNQNQSSKTTYHQTNSQNLYKCSECGSMTTYPHRHHLESTVRRVTTDIEDPGYESGNRRRNNRHRQYIEHRTSSDSEIEENPTYVDMSILNEAYDRAKKVQQRSQNLSRNISRQLKLVLTTM